MHLVWLVLSISSLPWIYVGAHYFLMVMLWQEIDDMYYVCDVEFIWVVVLGGGVSHVVE